MAKRRPGAGSLYQRSSDGRWVGQVRTGDVTNRRRVTVYGTTRSEAEAKLNTIRAEHGIEVKPEHTAALRQTRMDAARAIGTHTAREWGALMRAADYRCYYCGANCFARPTKDHAIPVSRGGSDSIDNLVLACRECNIAKHNWTLDEFLSVKGREERHAEYREAAIARGRLAGDGIPRGRF